MSRLFGPLRQMGNEICARALAAGYVVCQEGDASRGRLVYCRNAGHPGTVIEISHATAARKKVFDAVHATAVGWNGEDPIRTGWPTL